MRLAPCRREAERFTWSAQCGEGRSGFESNSKQLTMIIAESEPIGGRERLRRDVLLADLDMNGERTTPPTFGNGCLQSQTPQPSPSVCRAHKQVVDERVQAAVLHTEPHSERHITGWLAFLRNRSRQPRVRSRPGAPRSLPIRSPAGSLTRRSTPPSCSQAKGYPPKWRYAPS
jgi:hypothetical protein